jgi:hypothetical protein
MCQKGGNREGSHDRSDGGYCRNIKTDDDLSSTSVDVYLKSHSFPNYSRACRGIWVIFRLEADTSTIGQLASDVAILSGETPWLTYPLSVPEGTDYYLSCKYHSDLSRLLACFVLCYLTQWYRDLRTTIAHISRSGMYDAK